MNRASLFALLLLAACTHSQIEGLRTAVRYTETGCRAFLEVRPEASDKIAAACRKLLDAARS